MEHIPEEARESVKMNVQVDTPYSAVVLGEAQFDPRALKAEFGEKLTGFQDFLRENEALLKEFG